MGRPPRLAGRSAGSRAWFVALGIVQLVLEPAASLAYPSVFNLGQVGEVRNISPYAISPILWAVLVIGGVIAAVRLGPGRWGWAAAVVLSVFASPRLLVYQLMTLVAATRSPDERDRGSLAAPTARPEPAPPAADGP